uniref:Uncharacterized protein n=1 Tax=Hucho hucho TaxID=62062 RepID=A0A4W5JVT4_9TELE
MGTRLGLHYDTLATGIIYFHRFYMFHSFKQFPRYVSIHSVQLLLLTSLGYVKDGSDEPFTMEIVVTG